MSSLRAWTGATIISPAAILLTTSGSSAYPRVRIEIANQRFQLTLILLGAVTTLESSVAFLFVPLDGSPSTSIGSAIGWRCLDSLLEPLMNMMRNLFLEQGRRI
jgi:hypothetical protein